MLQLKHTKLEDVHYVMENHRFRQNFILKNKALINGKMIIQIQISLKMIFIKITVTF